MILSKPQRNRHRGDANIGGCHEPRRLKTTIILARRISRVAQGDILESVRQDGVNVSDRRDSQERLAPHLTTARDYPSAPAGLAKRIPPPGTLFVGAGRRIQ